jgi:UDP-3-O-[3-hydroxymyristoyl] glucosamine N-acyltransferase
MKKKNNAFPFSDFDNNRFNDLEFYIGLGYHHLGRKREVCEQLAKNLFNFPFLIHKTAYIHPSARIGSGVIIYPMCNIGFEVQISDGVHINNSSVISHDSFIGKCTFISPGVTLSGYVQIGGECFLGAGTVVANGLKSGIK